MPTAVEARATALNPAADQPSNPALADVTVDSFLLDGRPMDAQVVDALIDVSLNRSIGGASAIVATLTDGKLELLNSKLFAKAVEVRVDDHPFILADLALTSNNNVPGLSLEFQPRAIAKLMALTAPMHASRNDKTRAEFIKALCDAAGVTLICPSLHKKQPIQSVKDAMTPAQKRKAKSPGLKRGVHLTIKGVVADSEQIGILDRALSVAHSLDAVVLAQIALVEALIVESTCRNLPSGDSTSRGVLQVLSSTAADQGIDQMDVEACVHAFLVKGFTGKGGAIALAAAHPDWDPGRIAQTVQGSNVPTAYEQRRGEANAALVAFGTSSSDVSSPAAAEFAKAYMFRTLTAEETSSTQGPENYYVCARRLADEVNWRLWEADDQIYFMNDDDILKAAVEITITPTTEGVRSLTGNVSTRRPDQEIVIECDARRWTAPPGTVCEVEGYGPTPTSTHTATLSGRWIVAEIDRPSLFATDTTITLHRRQAAKLEPAHDVGTRSAADAAAVDSSGVDLTAPAAGTIRARVVDAANKAAALSASDPTYYIYSQAGVWKNDLYARDGRGPSLVPLVGPPLPGSNNVLNRSDCSSFVIQCFTKAGCKLPSFLQGQGNTESLALAGTQTSHPQPGDVVLYGLGPAYEHCELYVGPNDTIGHGNAAIDHSTPHGPAAFAGYWTFSFLDG